MQKKLLLILLIAFSLNVSAQWTSVSVSSVGQIEGMDFVSPTTGFICGGAGVAKTTNGGSTWSASSSTGARDLDFVDSLNGFLTGVVGLMQKTTNGGSTWVTLTAPTSSSLWGVSAVDASIA